MAGISLVYSKKEIDNEIPVIIEKITNYHRFSDQEVLFHKTLADKVAAGVVSLPKKSIRPKYYAGQEVECFVDGTIFIQQTIKSGLTKKYSVNYDEDEQLLPYLWKEYQEESWKYLYGWFNWLIIDTRNSDVFLLNDRFGMLPCYYYENDKYISFVSKYTSLLTSGITKPVIDSSIVLQFIAFAYPVSDKTFIADVKVLPSASILKISRNKLAQRKYWLVDELIHRKHQSLSTRESIPLIYESLKSVLKRITSGSDYFAITLTGGWDGRVVLAFLDKIKKDNFFLYSHGSESNNDITIPMKLAEDFGYSYTPVLLNDEYLARFNQCAIDTLRFSDGLRPISRTPYLYSSEILRHKTNTLISGNCGSNLIKSIVNPSTLYNQNILRLFQAESIRDEAGLIYDEIISQNFLDKKTFHKEQFVESIIELDITGHPEFDQAQRFYRFLLSSIERKYFGVEIASYAHNVFNYSPFIDFEFIDAITQTPFFGAFSDFRSPGKLKILSTTRLYAKLIGMNSEKLAKYPTDRGFALADLETVPGMIRSGFRYWKEKQRRRRPNVNNYNFRDAVLNFNDQMPVVENEFMNGAGLIAHLRENKTRESLINTLSWGVWFADLKSRLMG